ncbi:MAG: hypothetical protein AAGN66_20815 [Acidobacteriota bacterium]
MIRRSLAPRPLSPRRRCEARRSFGHRAIVPLLGLLTLGGPAISQDVPGLEFQGTLDVPTNGGGAAVKIVGDLLLVPLDDLGVEVYDISDLSDPMGLTIADTSILGDRAGAVTATADGSRMFVDLVTQPQTAVLDLGTNPPTRLGVFGAHDFTRDLVLFGDRLVVNAGSTFDFLGGIFIFDAVPDVPEPEGNYLVDLVDPGFLVTEDGLALMARTPAGRGTGDGGFEAIDITGANPVSLGYWETPLPGNVTGISVSGDRAFVSAYWGGLWTVDISDPANMAYEGGFDFAEPQSYALDVEAVGDLVYLLQGGPPGFPNQVVAYRVSPTLEFTELGTIPLGNIPIGIVRGGSKLAVDELVDLDGDFFYETRRIRLYSVAGPEIFVDGFESGDLTAWSGQGG